VAGGRRRGPAACCGLPANVGLFVAGPLLFQNLVRNLDAHRIGDG
jgi:hypothetical protein